MMRAANCFLVLLLVVGFMALGTSARAGDNKDDGKSGKVDVFGDGDSGQGNDPSVGDAVSDLLDDDVADSDDASFGDDKAGAEKVKKLRKEYDKDRDGKLNDEEREKAKKGCCEMREREWKAQMKKEADRDHDGKLNEMEERGLKEWCDKRIAGAKEHRRKIAGHFDHDGDGKLDKGERGQLRKEWCEHEKKHHGDKEHDKDKEHEKDKDKDHERDKDRGHDKHGDKDKDKDHH